MLHECVEWCDKSALELNTEKTKEMVVTFSTKQRELAVAAVNRRNVDIVEEYKRLQKGAAVAQSVETWHGERRVAGSSPAMDHNMEVDWKLKRCQFTSLAAAEVPLSKAPNQTPICSPGTVLACKVCVYLYILTIYMQLVMGQNAENFGCVCM